MTFLSAIGFVSLAGIAMLITVIIFQALKSIFEEYKRKQAVKRRFDKPPLAKCYCVDCDSYEPETGECEAHDGWLVADNWFCWSATPNYESRGTR